MVLPLIHKAVVLSKEPQLAALELLLPCHKMNVSAQGTRLSQLCPARGCKPAPAWPFKAFLS